MHFTQVRLKKGLIWRIVLFVAEIVNPCSIGWFAVLRLEAVVALIQGFKSLQDFFL